MLFIFNLNGQLSFNVLEKRNKKIFIYLHIYNFLPAFFYFEYLDFCSFNFLEFITIKLNFLVGIRYIRSEHFFRASEKYNTAGKCKSFEIFTLSHKR